MPDSSTLNTSNQYVKYRIRVSQITDITNNSSIVRVEVRFWRTNTGYETYGTGTVYVKIDGTQYTQAVKSNQKITNSGINLFEKEFTIKHDADGKKTINVQAKISLGSVLSSEYQGFNVKLTDIIAAPTAPTSFNISAGYGNYVGLGDWIKLTWSGVTGNVTGYQVQYKLGNSGWKDWWTGYSSTSKSGTLETNFGSTDINLTGAGKQVQFRIRAYNSNNPPSTSVNSNITSPWKESNILYISGGMDIKVSNAWKTGSTWINVNGSWKRAKRVWIKVNGTWKSSI